MLNFRKYAAVTMLAVGLGVVTAEPAPAGDYGHGYAYGPYAHGSAYPYYSNYRYRPLYRHRFHTYSVHRTFYPPGTGGG
jgi:hypothetical protein